MKLKVGRYAVEITHPDKILFGKSGITKADMVNYYHTIAPIMMPHINDRLISMQRFPQGITEEGFFQKDAADYFPSWITRVPVAKQTGGSVDYVVIDKPATLIYLANQNCITPHIWLSKTDNLEKPDRMIFDLDVEDAHSFERVQDVAKKLKLVLDQLELPTFCMLTGSRGAHIVVPLKRLHTFDETRAFAHDVATLLAQQFPKFITVDVHKAKRGNRVFIDWLRNGFGATTVAPYAVRALEGAPVAMPVMWQELQKKGMSSQKYTIKNVMKRITKVGDIWRDMQKCAVTLKGARRKLDNMLKD
jgi:bifunctional non-homologous end joining protein LigD